MTGRRALDAVVLAVLVLIALVPLATVFGSSTAVLPGSASFWLAAAGGVVSGAALAVAAAEFRWGLASTALAVIVAYFLLGGALALRSTTLVGVIPSLDTLSGLALGAVRSWKELLTLQPPVVGFESVLLVPLVLGLVGAASTISFGVRLRRPAVAIVPAALVLLLAIAFSTYQAWQPVVVGVVFVLVATGWVAWHRLAPGAQEPATARNLATGAAGGRATGRRLVGAVVVVAVGLGLGGAASAVTRPDAARAVLRDSVVPPLDLRDYASPLESFRKYVKDGKKVDLFTVSGLPDGARVRLATMDAFDGVVFNVSDDAASGSGAFSRVGDSIAPPAGTSTAGARTATFTITVDDYSGVWMPETGDLTSLRFAGADAETRDAALHYNAGTGTAITTTPLASGDAYGATTVIPVTPSATAIRKATVSAVSTPAPQNVPEAVATATATATKGARTPTAQVEAIASWLHDNGYFSHGLSGQVTSRAGHTSERVTTLLTGKQMVGDDEQYAVTMALMVARLGLPVRVVLGFEPKGSGQGVVVTGDDVHAWVEVPFDGLGWVAFSPTPDESRVPSQQVPEPQTKPQAQVPQPPVEPAEPADLPAPPPVKQADRSPVVADLGWLWTTLRVGGISLLVIALLLAPSLALGILKARRTRRRTLAGRPADRIEGGWSEVVDTARDHGLTAASGATRREDAALLSAAYPALPISALATRADTAVFGPSSSHDSEVDGYWRDVATVTIGIRRGSGRRQRFAARFAPRSVLRDLRAGGLRAGHLRSGRSRSGTEAGR